MMNKNALSFRPLFNIAILQKKTKVENEEFWWLMLVKTRAKSCVFYGM
jgi:hypothetical protein